VNSTIKTFARPKIYIPTSETRVNNALTLRPEAPGPDIKVSFHSAKNIISPVQKIDLLKRASAARAELQGVDSLEDRHKIIAKYFTNPQGDPDARYLAENEIIVQFVRDSKTADYTKMADLIDLHEANFIIGEFKVPYNPDLKEKSLELITFDKHEIKKELKDIYPSHAIAVRNTRSTAGFTNELIVAYFRENMVGVDGKAAHAKAYYFVDKFLNRIKNYSFPTLRGFVDKNSFVNFRKASDEQLLNGIANWLSAHEFFHADATRTPLERILRSQTLDDSFAQKNRAYAFKLKNTKTTGAFEELRVDTNAILATFDPESTAQFGFNQDKIARELIMAERIIRYGVNQNPNEGFDAITSYVLINFLANFKPSNSQESPLTFTKEGKLRITSDEVVLKEAFTKLAQEMNEVETQIASTIDLSTRVGMKQGRQMINKFMLKYANAHSVKNYEPVQAEIEKPTYVLHPFFRMAQKGKSPWYSRLQAHWKS
jgi:hypothetical protein